MVIIKAPPSAFTTEEQLERELSSFFDYCKEIQLSEEEIQKICEPLVTEGGKSKLMRRVKFGGLMCVVLLGMYALCCNETFSWHLTAIGRILLIKFLPIYDWNHLRNEKCLVSNPFGEETDSTPSFNCAVCESVSSVDVLTNPDEDEILENYIHLDVPVIISNTSKTWRLHQNLTGAVLADAVLGASYPCKMSTNAHPGHDALSRVLKRLPRFRSHFLHFQNCEFAAVKRFRILAPRPGFLGAGVGPVQYSWLLVSRDYRVGRFKSVDLQERVTVVGQKVGSNVFRLIPQGECAFDCSVLVVELREGEALVFTSLWNLEYKPLGEGENVAVILETH